MQIVDPTDKALDNRKYFTSQIGFLRNCPVTDQALRLLATQLHQETTRDMPSEIQHSILSNNRTLRAISESVFDKTFLLPSAKKNGIDCIQLIVRCPALPSSDRQIFRAKHECRLCKSRDAEWITAVSVGYGPLATGWIFVPVKCCGTALGERGSGRTFAELYRNAISLAVVGPLLGYAPIRIAHGSISRCRPK